jgi:hypothetical protein
MSLTVKKLAAMLICGSTFVLSACGYSTHYIDLTYPPSKLLVFKTPAISRVDTDVRSRELMLAVVDKREAAGLVGRIMYEFGPNGSVLTESNTQIWVHDAISTELANQGYTVTAGGGANLPDKLSVDIINIYCLIAGTYTGKVKLKATLDAEGRQPVTGEFIGNATAGLRFGSNDIAAAESLARALQRSIRAMLYDFGYTPAKSANLVDQPD